ncbi:MAG: czcA 1 [Deferribacteraceae bacterium]|nr:czcA 1 [Deferribacteraceae bacterium]
MISIPFGIIGAIIGHILMGYSLSLVSIMGIVALSGVVVNDSLVLIDLANRKVRDGVYDNDYSCAGTFTIYCPGGHKTFS